MKRKIIFTACILVWITLVQAREFWLQPNRFIFEPGESLVLKFNVGENFIGGPWNLGRQAITRFESHQLSKTNDLLALVKEGDKNPLMIPLQQEGTHLILMESNNAFIEREGDSFNQFLKDEGQDEAYAYREKTNALKSPGKEFYSCHTKLLVQVGSRKDDTYKKGDGFPVEIIPEQNPYSLRKGDPVRFKILSDGKPLFGVRVKVWNRFDNRTTLQNIYTEKNGVIETRVSNPGPWMVTVVKMVPAKQPGADWQSYRVSLVFGIAY
jgi:uncharacterized GH25 family protein